MAGFVLFETTESVIELLWDVALAFFIVRLGFIYFALNFASGLLLSTLAYYFPEQLTPLLAYAHLTMIPTTMTALSEFVLVGFVLAGFATLWARFLVVHYEIPRVAGFRLAIGATALVLASFAESIAALVLVEQGKGAWLWSKIIDLKTDAAFGGLLAVFTLMPWLQMGFEQGRSEGEVFRPEAAHGHEKKTLVDAIPTVNMSEKTQETKKTK
ncbi:hypothetical protein B0H63DRAFT_458645 [Podospora didyma]|uniref:Uncharacterized protein n=1 Tax=Podospora didyma TaxID=330526 RepID=A0AAE0U797_9PEZI|nr:hypothetical protein B0H63DRAFT_458645 [Podospora didyma]